ncbi:MAG: ATPase [Marinilabiliales bacterium]|nr:MAG: ATPase [Marinilabiliales bacterium]
MFKIAIASGKGGTGKTTLSVNLAAMLSDSESVRLCDMDVEEPDSGLFLNVDQKEKTVIQRFTPQWDEDKCTLCGKCQENCNFNAVIRLADQIMIFPELCHSCYACSELCPKNALPMIPSPMGVISSSRHEQLRFTEARLNVGVEQAVPLITQTHQYLNNLNEKAKFVIIDSPPGTSCPMIHTIKEADFVILVTEPTPFGLHDLQLAVETVRQLGIPMGVVINRGDDNNTLITDFCTANSIDVMAIIKNDRSVAAHYAAGDLVYKHVSTFRESVETIAGRIQNLLQ